MSGIVNNRIFLDGLREREAVAGAIAGALRDLEAHAARTGERVIWSSISFETGTRVHWTGSFSLPDTHEIRSLSISARTINPAEVADA